ncbi:hypothetical protein C8J57DRAFT_1229601 [Mycena rebaudengoi]|nr:hypothetical protein C8J57DRAFT_1229601 [Mycena rebaudengoi]
MAKKRQRERIPKEERHNLRLWADGARETILAPHLNNFTAARTKGSHMEKAYLQTVCNEFHVRVDWRLADHEEPELKPWTPDAIIIKETLSDDEEKQSARELSCSTCASANGTLTVPDISLSIAALDWIPERIRTLFFWRSFLACQHRPKRVKPTNNSCARLIRRRLPRRW